MSKGREMPYQYVDLGPGVQAGLRVTRDGRVKLCCPGGELDVTDGAGQLSDGLNRAAVLAVQIRNARVERARRAKRKPLCRRCGESLYGYPAAELASPGRSCAAGGLCEPVASNEAA